MPHIVTSFENQLRALKQAIIEMGRLSTAQVAASLESLEHFDLSLAERVIADDERLDDLEHRVDDDVIRLLALRQPMGGDLRRTIAALKIAADLERIGDYAKNIAKRTIAVGNSGPVDAVAGLAQMGRLALSILDEAMTAYADRDAERAIAAWHRDRELDKMHTERFAALLQAMVEQPAFCTSGTHYLFVAKNIERIGDHATNIAENVFFLITGKPMTGTRPKDDDASFTVVGEE